MVVSRSSFFNLRALTGFFAVTLAALVWGVYWRVGGADFLLWDDDINIQTNTHLRGITWENLKWMFTDVSYMRRYVPLTWLGWAIDFELYGLTPRGAHLENVVFHALNAILVFLSIRQILRQVARHSNIGISDSAVLLAAWLGAAIWAVHPLRVEPVAWASGRIYCVATSFLLLSTIAYLEFGDASSSLRRRRVAGIVSWLAYTLSLLTYPLGISFALILVGLDIFVLHRLPDSLGRWFVPRIWLEKLCFALPALAVTGVTLWARAHAAGLWEAAPTLEQFGILPRLAQAFYVWTHYLVVLLLPLHLSPSYPALLAFKAGEYRFVASFIVVVATTGLVWWKRRTWRSALGIWLCYLILLVPMLGLTEHPHYTNDRYSHLASLPWSVALCGLVVATWEQVRLRWSLILAMSIAILMLASLSFNQVKVWQNSANLFQQMLLTFGSSPYRSDVLMRMGEMLRGQGKFDEAIERFEEALRINPSERHAHFALGLIAEGRGENRVALENYAAAARTEHDPIPALERMAALLLRLGRPVEAVPHLEAVVRLQPDSAGHHFNLGFALRQAGRVDEAKGQFETAVRLRPDFVEARQALADFNH